jgi:hypothetical protein
MGQYELRVPDELIDRLHHATDRFHESRAHLEAAMNGSDFRHQERVNAAGEELRQAEREIERIEDEIRTILSKPVETDSQPGAAR